jgi:hypothetical protein
MFWKRAPKPSTVELFEIVREGAAFSWNDERSRTVALEMFVEIARRLDGEDAITRLRLRSVAPEPLEPDDPIDVADMGAFVQLAPRLLRHYYRAYEFEFRLNTGKRVYGLRPLDQSGTGFWFVCPRVEQELVYSTLKEVLTAFAERGTDVRISTGPWFEPA